MSSCSLVIVHASLKNMVSRKTRFKFLVPKTEFSSKTAKNSWLPQFFEFRPEILHAYFWMHMQSNNDEKKYRFFDPFTGEAPLKRKGHVSGKGLCIYHVDIEGFFCAFFAIRRGLELVMNYFNHSNRLLIQDGHSTWKPRKSGKIMKFKRTWKSHEFLRKVRGKFGTV